MTNKAQLAPGNTDAPLRVGEMRVSQVLTTYGIGSIVDLPQLSVMVLGLDDWPSNTDARFEISEPRLLGAVQAELPAVQHLRSLPVASNDDMNLSRPLDASQTFGVPVRVFPQWMVCPACRVLAGLESGLFTLEAGTRTRPDRVRYVHANCQKATKPPAAVSARFMVACEEGHLDEFPWIDFVHRSQPCLSPRLRLLEHGPSGEARDLVVECEACGQTRRMAEAFEREKMPACTGRRPHLHDRDPNGCKSLHVRTILLGASNLWFPVIYSSIAIPDLSSQLDEQIRRQWSTFQHIEEIAELRLMQRRGELSQFVDVSHELLFERITAIKHEMANGQPARRGVPDTQEIRTHDSLKAPEWRIFSQRGAAANVLDFKLRAVPVPPAYREVIEQVVLVERLREVRALAGFTRIEAPGEIADLDREIIGAHLAPMTRQPPRWVPTTEMRGEGIFIQFNERAVQQWQSKDANVEWNREFLAAHRHWREARRLQDPDRDFPHLRYVLLHTFAHALMRQFALECGYAQSSIRERIYSREPYESDGPMAGILIYTSATDSEGTLGGLVRLGETSELARHIASAIDNAKLCTSDPTCAEHAPDSSALTLHGASCHSCLFAPETSCERGNRYLDRSVLVETLTCGERAFFE